MAGRLKEGQKVVVAQRERLGRLIDHITRSDAAVTITMAASGELLNLSPCIIAGGVGFKLVSIRDALTYGDVSCLTPCPQRLVSPSCPLLREPHAVVIHEPRSFS